MSDNTIKQLHSFNLYKKAKVEVTEETNDGKLTKTVEKDVPVKVILKQLSRAESEEADFFYARELANNTRKGLLRRALLERYLDNEGGLLSDSEKERYKVAYTKLSEIKEKYDKLDGKENKSKKDDEKLKVLIAELNGIQGELSDLESIKENAFADTAEARAQNKQILWLTCFMVYIEDDGKSPEPLLRGKELDDKVKYYDTILEDNSSDESKQKSQLYFQIFDITSLLVRLWATGKITSKEQFEAITQVLVVVPTAPEDNKGLEGKDSESDKEVKEPITDIKE